MRSAPLNGNSTVQGGPEPSSQLGQAARAGRALGQPEPTLPRGPVPGAEHHTPSLQDREHRPRRPSLQDRPLPDEELSLLRQREAHGRAPLCPLHRQGTAPGATWPRGGAALLQAHRWLDQTCASSFPSYPREARQVSPSRRLGSPSSPRQAGRSRRHGWRRPGGGAGGEEEEETRPAGPEARELFDGQLTGHQPPGWPRDESAGPLPQVDNQLI